MLLASFVAFNALDLLATLSIVGLGGVELNPIMRVMLAQPFPVLLAFKVGLPLLFGLLLTLLQMTNVLRVVLYFTIAYCLVNAIGLVIGT